MTDWQEQQRKEQEWRDGLKAGDEVYVWELRRHTAATVERTTKAQIFVRGLAFWRRDGRMVGRTPWATALLAMPSDAIREEAEINTLTAKARRLAGSLKIPATKPELERFIAALEGLKERKP